MFEEFSPSLFSGLALANTVIDLVSSARHLEH